MYTSQSNIVKMLAKSLQYDESSEKGLIVLYLAFLNIKKKEKRNGWKMSVIETILQFVIFKIDRFWYEVYIYYYYNTRTKNFQF